MQKVLKALLVGAGAALGWWLWLPAKTPSRSDDTPPALAPNGATVATDTSDKAAAGVTAAEPEAAPTPAPRRSPVAAEANADTATTNPYAKASATLAAGFDGDHWLTQGDILVPESALGIDGGANAPRSVTLPQVALWPHGVVPFVLTSGVDSALVEAVFKAFASQTPIRFVPRSDENDYLVFRLASVDVCQSFLGRQGGEQEVMLGPRCTAGQVMHEMMHALGFVHEQSRADRDQYVRIHWDRIDPPYLNQFQMIPAAAAIATNLPFDFDSVLLYPSDAFAKTPGEATITKADGSSFTVNRRRLSPGDIAKLQSLYGGAG